MTLYSTQQHLSYDVLKV